MGRAVLIIAVAAILGLGTIMYSSQQTHIATDKTTGDYEFQVLARDVARSGVDRGLSETKRALDDVRTEWSDVDVAGGVYDLNIQEVMYGDMDIVSTGLAGDKSHTIKSNVIFEAPIPAALVVNGPSINFNGMSTGFKVSGEDMRMPSRGSGKGFMKPAHGVMVKSGSQASAIQASVDGSLMTGQGGKSSVISGADASWYDKLYAEAVAHTGAVRPVAPFSGSYGTPVSPAIVHIKGDFEPAGSFKGAGLLIVEDGNFTVSDFTWEGIVMVRKSTVPTVDVNLGGNAKIYGALVAYESDAAEVPEVCTEVPFDISGLETIPQIDYKVRFDVLGAAISSGGKYDMPVTSMLHVGDLNEEPWGSYGKALDGNLNTGLVYDWEPSGALEAGTPLTISARSWTKKDDTDGSGNTDWSIYMEQNSLSGGQQLKVLRDGDPVPNIKGYLDQSSVEDYIGKYIGEDGTVQLEKNQAIYLFELGTSNQSSDAFDMQDLVVVVTLAAAEESCPAQALATGDINMNLGGSAGLFYSGEAIAKLGRELQTVRAETKVVIASQKEVASD